MCNFKYIDIWNNMSIEVNSLITGFIIIHSERNIPLALPDVSDHIPVDYPILYIDHFDTYHL